MSNKGALAGVRVLDLSRLLPGPYCSMILADHGADVIAIENRKFQDDGLFFEELYRNKRHMSLNLKNPKGKEIFSRLVRDADVVLEGFRPGVVDRLGVDYEALCQINPGIIYCSISGYGQTGPKRYQVGHDVNYLSTAGVLNLIGEEGGAPTIPAVQIADILGGAMQAAVGILMALYSRTQSGRGQYIDISMTEGVLGLLTLPRFFQQKAGEQPLRSATTLSHKFACYNTYKTKDNRYVAIGAVENRFWHRLCEHLGRPEFAELQYDNARRLELIDWLRETFSQKNLAEWDAELSDLDVCYSAVATVDEIVDSPFFRERQMIHLYPGQNGKLCQTFTSPVKLSETPAEIHSSPATFGQHTREILRELGYSNSYIDEFAGAGVV
ncbi:CaiB/BaiF CoA transferase family protein [Desulfosediminicola ganghwensis]|uniref:CaiB/BaiF CoA transferase family protein n=1 Tax=Desulfosediminicola ganghwensis TaxID=2569540 RepID=UPI0010AD5BE9|nr:CaiB/BaiF CoA-transferase family protein [Desulfosediminicola ganghwensis]